MMTETIKSEVRGFLAKQFRNYELRDDEDIFSLGFVNSLFAMKLVMFVEKTFDITIEDQDLEIDNFRTIDAISTLVGNKLS